MTHVMEGETTEGERESGRNDPLLIRLITACSHHCSRKCNPLPYIHTYILLGSCSHNIK